MKLIIVHNAVEQRSDAENKVATGTISPYGILGYGTALIHLICTDCGWILGSYVENHGSFRKMVEK